MKQNYFLMLSYAIGFTLLISACSAPPPAGKIILTKTEYNPGEEIKLILLLKVPLAKNHG